MAAGPFICLKVPPTPNICPGRWYYNQTWPCSDEMISVGTSASVDSKREEMVNFDFSRLTKTIHHLI